MTEQELETELAEYDEYAHGRSLTDEQFNDLNDRYEEWSKK